MMISGANSSSSDMFSNYRLANSSTSTYQSVQEETEGAKGAKGQGGPPPPPPGGGKGPDVDTNSDNVWDTDELTSLSEELSESGATSFSVDELMETYDTDEDGVISATESEAVEKNNGFNLSDMKSMQEVMMNGSRGLQIQEASDEEVESAEIEDRTVKKMISAYMQQSQYTSSYVTQDMEATTVL